MTLLILGGTADGRKLAERLHNQGLKVIYSVAGLVRMPTVSCQVISGGFSQLGGLSSYIQQQHITAIIDVTHPHAAIMSTTAIAAARYCGIPCWRFHRPAWQPQVGDNWHSFKDWQSLLPELSHKKSLFLTAGQLTPKVLAVLAKNTQHQLLRTAVKPKATLPKQMQWLKAIGPFSKANETAIMQRHNIDVLVTKNSGGESTQAKLTVARELGITVLMLERPLLPKADKIFNTLSHCESHIIQNINCG